MEISLSKFDIQNGLWTKIDRILRYSLAAIWGFFATLGMGPSQGDSLLLWVVVIHWGILRCAQNGVLRLVDSSLRSESGVILSIFTQPCNPQLLSRVCWFLFYGVLCSAAVAATVPTPYPCGRCTSHRCRAHGKQQLPPRWVGIPTPSLRSRLFSKPARPAHSWC